MPIWKGSANESNGETESKKKHLHESVEKNNSKHID